MKYFSFLLIFLFSFSIKQDELDSDLDLRNKLEFVSANMETILFKLKNKEKIDIFHIGDSHVQIGEFSKGILQGFESEKILVQKAWFFPSLIFTEIHSNPELIKVKGKFTAENIRNNPHLLAGITGRNFSSSEKQFNFKFRFSKKITSLQILHENFETYSIQSSKAAKITQAENKGIQVDTVVFDKKSNVFKLKYKTENFEKKDFYGFKALESGKEHLSSYSNCGVSGAKFSDFYHALRIYEQIELLKPHLIVMTLGTNDSYFKDWDKSTFSRQLVTFIRKIKEISPNTGIIIMSAPDTFYQNQKPIHLNQLNETINTICKQEQVALWDWNKIMGGENSIHFWAQKKMVDADLLHFNSTGYSFFGKLFAQALLN
jgi:lysophospholipase L1-like esterase